MDSLRRCIGLAFLLPAAACTTYTAIGWTADPPRAYRVTETASGVINKRVLARLSLKDAVHEFQVRPAVEWVRGRKPPRARVFAEKPGLKKKEVRVHWLIKPSADSLRGEFRVKDMLIVDDTGQRVAMNYAEVYGIKDNALYGSPKVVHASETGTFKIKGPSLIRMRFPGVRYAAIKWFELRARGRFNGREEKLPGLRFTPELAYYKVKNEWVRCRLFAPPVEPVR